MVVSVRASTLTVNAVRWDSVFERHHQRKIELVEALRRERHADDPGSVGEEEGDLRRGGGLGGHDEVALVLAVLAVDDDDAMLFLVRLPVWRRD